MHDEQSELALRVQSMKSVLPTVSEDEKQAFVDSIADLENRLAFLANLEAELQRAEWEAEQHDRSLAALELPSDK